MPLRRFLIIALIVVGLAASLGAVMAAGTSNISNARSGGPPRPIGYPEPSYPPVVVTGATPDQIANGAIGWAGAGSLVVVFVAALVYGVPRLTRARGRRIGQAISSLVIVAAVGATVYLVAARPWISGDPKQGTMLGPLGSEENPVPAGSVIEK